MGSPPKPPSIFTRSNQSNQQTNNPKNLILTKPHTNQSSCALLCVALFSLSCPVLCPVLCSVALPCPALPCPLCPALPCLCRVSRPLPIIYLLTLHYLPTYYYPLVLCVSLVSYHSLVFRVLPTYRAIAISLYLYRLTCFRLALLPCSFLTASAELVAPWSCHAGMAR
jgi:hypothetical protein